ncbi:hypothetical protein BU17DRAFT_100543 [Hysterangium stoloniferum]|nr:hypothetical protein BU17DRAFT_100543 [Hysterangium stoloniferum]
MPFPTREHNNSLHLIRSISCLSLDLSKSCSSSKPPSFDPMSPSYDPCAASPCNPFPTLSPFATIAFKHPRVTSSLRFEEEASPVGSLASLSPQEGTPNSVISRIPPPHSAPSLRRTKPCRFYLDPAGCKSGRWCNFKHPVGARSDDVTPRERTLEELRNAVIRSRLPAESPESSSEWDDVPDVRDIDPNWGREADGDVHPKFRSEYSTLFFFVISFQLSDIAQPCRNFLLGLCRYGDKCQFIHAPGLFPPSAAPTSLPIKLLSDAPVPVPISVWGMHSGVGVTAEAASPQPASNKSGQTGLFYRTKPCKFFDTDQACPHGEDCKFIHDRNKSAPSSATEVPSSSSSHAKWLPSSWADCEDEIDFDLKPQFDNMNTDSSAMQGLTIDDAASKTNSMRRRERARMTKEKKSNPNKEPGGIFKPTWRVVGGGVMLANPAKRDSAIVEDEDTVFTLQPCHSDVLEESPLAQSESSRSTATLPSPTSLSPEYLTIDASITDLSQFTFATPTHYAPDDLLRPPSPDVPLDITMASPDVWTPPPTSVRKKRPITGAELMQGIMRGSVESDTPSQLPAAPRRSVSPKDRSKPRLTISVPTPSQTHRRVQSYSVKGSAGALYPYPSPLYRPTGRVAAARRDVEAAASSMTPTGEDILDWGDEVEAEDEAGLDVQEIFHGKAEIRRPHSTPPTPWTGPSAIDAPIMPKLPAESP